MTCDNIIPGPYNIGDMSLLPGEDRNNIKTHRVLFTSDNYVNINPDDFDESGPMPGSKFSDADEQDARKATTY